MEGPTYKGRGVKGGRAWEGKREREGPRLLRFPLGSRGARIDTAQSEKCNLPHAHAHHHHVLPMVMQYRSDCNSAFYAFSRVN